MQANTISNANRNAIDGVEKNSTHLNDSINYSLVFNDSSPHLENAGCLIWGYAKLKNIFSNFEKVFPFHFFFRFLQWNSSLTILEGRDNRRLQVFSVVFSCVIYVGRVTEKLA